ncbi:PepSY domain-containing protein [Streptomyces litchfieldiae]|uniref:PepSY domain-containing protein n=1 Tax=Streptomyces litchfieldiae TaxID=3075543 RepID=A0ABU2MJ37_9ACTN|nr:PepSY domain-containing protein [Streptomyces sp. DSM 44938]MDT0341383.1 hypothetical protein [Streptomyces sp. DSM 44938]
MKRNVIFAIVAAGAVIGGGTLAGAAMSSDGERTEPTSAALDDIAVAEAGADTGSGDDGAAGDDSGSAAEQAVGTAIGAVPGVVTDIELDADDGQGRGWEVEVYGEDEQWHRVRISEDGAEVLNSRALAGDDDDDDDRVAARSLLSESAEIDAAEAVRLAEEHTSALLREATVDDGHWELELRGEDGTEYELRINLASGEITDEERGDDDNGGGDDRDDRNEDDADDRDDDRDDRDDRNEDDADDRDDDQDDDRDDRDDRNDDADDRNDAADDGDDQGDDDADDR